MLPIKFIMANDAQPYFTADLLIGQWLGMSIPVRPIVGGRSHVLIDNFDTTRLVCRDSLFNPIIVNAEEDPGQVFLEMTVLNQGADQLNVEVPGSDILRLLPGQSATISYQRTAAMVSHP